MSYLAVYLSLGSFIYSAAMFQLVADKRMMEGHGILRGMFLSMLVWPVVLVLAISRSLKQ